MTLQQVAVQLYSLRKLELPFEEVLGHVASAGFSGVETVGNHNLSSAALKELLQTQQLQLCSSHVALNDLEKDLEGVCQFNLELGNRTLVVPWLSPEDRATSATAWQALGEKLAGLSAQCETQGLRLLYHNHDFEMVECDGKLALDWLFEGAKGSQLGLELDLAWVVRGNRDPLELLKRYQGRCSRVHVKDIAPKGENLAEDGWAHVGYGILNWPELLAAAKTAGAEWFIVEHDNPQDPVAFLNQSAAYLETLL